MAYSNKTTNYGLPQWDENDKPVMEDFNEAFAAIDEKVSNISLAGGSQGAPGPAGPQGPKGDPGPQGPKGDPGGGSSGAGSFVGADYGAQDLDEGRIHFSNWVDGNWNDWNYRANSISFTLADIPSDWKSAVIHCSGEICSGYHEMGSAYVSRNDGSFTMMEGVAQVWNDPSSFSMSPLIINLDAERARYTNWSDLDFWCSVGAITYSSLYLAVDIFKAG